MILGEERRQKLQNKPSHIGIKVSKQSRFNIWLGSKMKIFMPPESSIYRLYFLQNYGISNFTMNKPPYSKEHWWKESRYNEITMYYKQFLVFLWLKKEFLKCTNKWWSLGMTILTPISKNLICGTIFHPPPSQNVFFGRKT